MVFGGTEFNNGSLLELESGEYALYNGSEYYEEGDELTDHYWGIEEADFGDVTLDDAVALEWTNRGTRFYMYDGDSLYSQEYRDQNVRYETPGNLKSVMQ